MKWLLIAIAFGLAAATVASATPPSTMSFPSYYPPEADYNPLDDIKGWKDPSHFLEHGNLYVGSRSRAETQSIKRMVDADIADEPLRRRRRETMLLIDFLAIVGAGSIWLFGQAQRRAEKFKDQALNVAADSMLAASKIRTAAQGLRVTLTKRASERDK